jgi:hypothetical protein
MRYLAILGLSFLSIFFNVAGAFPGERNIVALRTSGQPDLSFLVGFKGGINFSVVFPTSRFSVLQPIDGTGASTGEKDYASVFSNLGYQYGFIGMLRLNKALSLSIEPTFSSYAIRYNSQSSWSSADGQSERIEIATDFTDKLKYFEIPLVLRYELGNGLFRPYLAAGFFYGMLTGASGTAESSTMQYVDNVEVDLENSESAGDIKGNYITTRLAIFPGAGLFVDLGFATLFAEADYYFGLHNIVNESARFSDQQSIGGDYRVPDNLKLDNLVINLGILFNINRGGQGGGQGKGQGSAVECPPIFKQKR